MTTNKNKKSVIAALSAISLMVSAASIQAQTQGNNAGTPPDMNSGDARGQRRPGIIGTVQSINEKTIIVLSKEMPQNNSGDSTDNKASVSKTYSVDTSNAKFIDNGNNSLISSIAVGDMVMIEGAINGTNITATAISKGLRRDMGNTGKTDNKNASSSSETKPSEGKIPENGRGKNILPEDQPTTTIASNNESGTNGANKSIQKTETKKAGFMESIINFFKNLFKL